ncbi:transmembrane ascorbate-dependent reductase CYB561-like [Paramacrobiotus metropolitanus]|uniref:transmembrane ascorbate-dependent reductase CYB561-like n=1 Tax=Paramacrobiotus metropolitanus TaxID=2943436 RepID=UPI0024461892|nr:transmembrane ascorbate-dependent reductase CYB561-like [Paramacrobiotus metropolitanus]
MSNSKSDSDFDAVMFRFNIAVGIFEILGVSTIFMLTGWINTFQGFTWQWRSDPEQEFFYHPFLATIAFVFVHGNANLVYRIFRNYPKFWLKIIHASLQFIAIVFMVCALIAVFDSHNLLTDEKGRPTPYPNLYSQHGWLGITIFIVFSLQWIFGFIAFLYPKANLSLAKEYMPIHVFFGILLFGLLVVQALLGLTEEQFYDVHNFESNTGEAALVNSTGYIIVFFGITGIYLMANPRFRRLPGQNDDGQYKRISGEEQE